MQFPTLTMALTTATLWVVLATIVSASPQSLQKRTEVANCYDKAGCQGKLLYTMDYNVPFGGCPSMVMEVSATRCDNCYSTTNCYTIAKGKCGPIGASCFHPLS